MRHLKDIYGTRATMGAALNECAKKARAHGERWGGTVRYKMRPEVKKWRGKWKYYARIGILDYGETDPSPHPLQISP